MVTVPSAPEYVRDRGDFGPGVSVNAGKNVSARSSTSSLREMRAMIVLHQLSEWRVVRGERSDTSVDFLERLRRVLPELQRERPVRGDHELQIRGVRPGRLPGCEAVPRFAAVVFGVAVDDPLAAFDRLRGVLVTHANLVDGLLARVRRRRNARDVERVVLGERTIVRGPRSRRLRPACGHSCRRDAPSRARASLTRSTRRRDA